MGSHCAGRQCSKFTALELSVLLHSGQAQKTLEETLMANPRQIVPPVDFVPRGVAPIAGAPTPHLTNHGGKVIGSVEVVPIYWGAAWASGANAQLASQLDGYFDYITQSSLIDMLAEYSVAGTQILHGNRLTSISIPGSEPGTVTPSGRQVTDAQIQQAIQG
jgi:hypothetical protein